MSEKSGNSILSPEDQLKLRPPVNNQQQAFDKSIIFSTPALNFASAPNAIMQLEAFNSHVVTGNAIHAQPNMSGNVQSSKITPHENGKLGSTTQHDNFTDLDELVHSEKSDTEIFSIINRRPEPFEYTVASNGQNTIIRPPTRTINLSNGVLSIEGKKRDEISRIITFSKTICYDPKTNLFNLNKNTIETNEKTCSKSDSNY